MKRLTAMILCLVFSAGMAGCSGRTNENSTEPPVQQETETVQETRELQENAETVFDEDTRIVDVMNAPVFEGYGQFLFPTQRRTPDEDMTLSDMAELFPMHGADDINVTQSVNTLNAMRDRAESGTLTFYDIYSDEEKADDPRKEDTGVFFFQGDAGAPFAVISAEGGFSYVASLHAAFPYALDLNERGYNAFVLQYRTGGLNVAVEDLARAISFIFEHADEIGVSTEDYSLWGGSAGGQMVARLSSYGTAMFGGDDLPAAAAIIMQYTAYQDYTGNEPATFACIGENDSMSSPDVMQNRIENLRNAGVETEFHIYPGLDHGWGYGQGTSAEGWIDDAVAFWERQMKDGAALGIPQTGMTQAVPAEYLEAAEQPGTVVRMDYDSEDYVRDRSLVTKTAYVYLPYGYDENDTETRYDIIYFMHGWGGQEGEYFTFGNGSIKNMLDHLIENGEIEPVIAVSPTFYNENSDRGFGSSVRELRQFHQEFVYYLMPTVEGQFHTYAQSTEQADLIASRDHRAFAGFSLGSVTTWMEFCYDSDYIRYFLPMSGSCWYYGGYGDYYPEETCDFFEDLIEEHDLNKRGYFIYAATGTNDNVRDQVEIQMAEMLERNDVFTPYHVVYYQKEGGRHDMNAVQEYIYNALPLFFHEF